jgi:DNA mismatch repair protein MutS
MVSASIKEANKIRNRHQVVSYLKENQRFHEKTQNQIKQISDLERLISKIAAGKVSREVIYLKESLDAIIPIKTLALESKQEAVKIIGDSLHSCELLREK